MAEWFLIYLFERNDLFLFWKYPQRQDTLRWWIRVLFLPLSKKQHEYNFPSHPKEDKENPEWWKAGKSLTPKFSNKDENYLRSRSQWGLSWVCFLSRVQAAHGRVEHPGLPGNGCLHSSLCNCLSLGHQGGFTLNTSVASSVDWRLEQELDRQILYQLSYKGNFGNPQTGWHRLGLPSCQAPLCMRDMHLWWKLTRPTAERSRKQERASHWSDAVILDPWTVSSSDQPHHCLPRLHKPAQLPSYLNYSGLNFCLLKPALMNNTPRPFWSTWNRIAQSYTFLSNLDLFLPNLDLFICKS